MSPPPPPYGRVVLLHFACRASLPIGSSLRVSSSELWSPGSLTPDDPMGAAAPPAALPGHGGNGPPAHHHGDDETLEHQVYTSSVALVTCPEEWPVWRTRTPVVLALGRGGRKHRYRYMVVTPGADNPATVGGGEEEEGEGGEGGKRGTGAVTSPENSGDGVGVEVMAWEDPFCDRESQLDLKHTTSANSLTSFRNLSTNLANLPYRTVEIDPTTAKIRYDRRETGDGPTQDRATGTEQSFTHDGICIDNWNRASDRSFCAYVVRDGTYRAQQSTPSASASAGRDNDSDMTDADADPDADADTEVWEECTETLQTDSPAPLANKDTHNNSQVSFGKLNEVIPFSDTPLTTAPTSMVLSPKQPILTNPNPNPPTPPKKQRIFFVCFHLPVIIARDPVTSRWSASWAESLLAPAEGSSIVRDHDAVWVGTVSDATHPIETQGDRDAIAKVLGEMNCLPLFLDRGLAETHYLGMCKQVLWPAFHNIDLLDLSASGWKKELHMEGASGGNGAAERGDGGTAAGSGLFGLGGRGPKKPTAGPPPDGRRASGSDWDQSRLDDWWNAYCRVNETFASFLSSRLRPGDIMWVHDYHLSLLPKLVDRHEHRTNNGRSVTQKIFFLHIPFPTSQIFRELECGKAILSGMLHADVVGFHAFDYARHFLNASKRILGLSYESLVGGLIGIKFRKKIVLVTMHNVSVEPKMVDAALRLPSVADKVESIRTKHNSRIVIAGVDIAQRLSGISLKLLAYERFLTDYPVWQEKVVMVQKCLLPRTRRGDEDRSIREVRYLVNRIRSRFGPDVIDCEEVAGSTLPIVERLALWKTSDVLVVTPIREGLNLLPFEYVFAKKKPAGPGVIISSEFSTVCSVMNGVIRVNPYDIQMTVAGIDKALTMDAEEKEGRRCRDTGFVQSTPSFEWMESVLLDLKDATTTTAVDTNTLEDTGSRDGKDVTSSTAAFLVREKEMAFTHLDMDSVRQVYDKTSNRVIILDLNGTVIEQEVAGKYLKGEFFGKSGHKPSPKVSQALRALCNDPRNTVFVVSGDSQENVEGAIGDITGLGLAASNGACFAPPLKPNETHRQWKYFDLGVNWDAVKKIVLPVFAKYTARSNGSFVKMTHSSIGWSYYSCDPEWGTLQASHLVMELENALHPFNVRFVKIKGIVEIVPQRLNKGLIVKNVLREVSDRGAVSDVDFILCMGDDIQDEKMFTSVFSFIAELEDPTHPTLSPPVIDGGGAPISSSVSAYYDDNDVPALQGTKVGNNNPLFAFTVAVGKKESHAFAYVDDAHDVETLLVKLSGRDVDIADKVMASAI